MNANKQTTSKMAAGMLPKQTTKCWIFWNLIDDIRDTMDWDMPLSDTLTIWAEDAAQTGVYIWAMENPSENITFEWPCWPTGRDNEVLHRMYDRLRNMYQTDHRREAWVSNEASPQEQNNSDGAIALAQAVKQRWIMAGRRR